MDGSISEPRTEKTVPVIQSRGSILSPKNAKSSTPLSDEINCLPSSHAAGGSKPLLVLGFSDGGSGSLGLSPKTPLGNSLIVMVAASSLRTACDGQRSEPVLLYQIMALERKTFL